MEPIKVITYNIDGLPEKLDLNDLPLILRPIAWIYRLFKKTTVITVNDGSNRHECTTYISDRLLNEDADIIAVQEDFNFHHDLIRFLRITHSCGHHSGDFDLRKLFSATEWLSHFPLPRFKADGLNIITKDKRVKILSEAIVPWNHSHGYISHANDLLTHKGFRHYELLIDGTVTIDLYNVHMDADFYDKDLCPDVQGDIIARRTQMQQLANYILARKQEKKNPIIITGDTNSLHSLPWDSENIREYLQKPFDEDPFLLFAEALPDKETVDRLFVINDIMADYDLTVTQCRVKTNYGRLSDHHPVCVTLNINKRR